MTEAEFMQWFMTEPPVLEWLQILYRIKMAENGKVKRLNYESDILIKNTFIFRSNISQTLSQDLHNSSKHMIILYYNNIQFEVCYYNINR